MSNATTVLVTGALGFIGRHVSRNLRSNGHRVIGIGHGDASANETAKIGIHAWLSGDVSRQALDALVEPIDLIVHCAGSSAVAASFNDPDSEILKNVVAAVEMLEFARHRKQPPRIVVLSSAAVYGTVTQLPISENVSPNPISPYGKSKLAIEQRCLYYGEKFGLEIAIVRFFSVYGRGLRKQLFWDACRKLANGDSRFGGSGDERRDWLHVDDAVRLIDLAATRASAAVPIFNGGSGGSIKVREALEDIRALWPTPTPEISFSGVARLGDPPGYEADITEARALGWASKREFKDGLAEYVAWAGSELA